MIRLKRCYSCHQRITSDYIKIKNRFYCNEDCLELDRGNLTSKNKAVLNNLRCKFKNCNKPAKCLINAKYYCHVHFQLEKLKRKSL